MTDFSTDLRAGRQASPVPPWWENQNRNAATLILIGIGAEIIYFLMARLGLALRSQPENIAVFWPAAGFTAGALVALGPSARWPIAIAVAVTTFAANMLERGSVWGGLAFGICNALECNIFAALFTRLDPTPRRLESLRSVAAFLVSAAVASAIAAIPAALVLDRLELSPSSLLDLWQAWFESDAIGILTVAPLLITLPALLRDPPDKPVLAESAVALLLTVLAAIYAYNLKPGSPGWPIITPITVLFPLFMWLAGRLPPAFSAAAALSVPFVIIITAVSGPGKLGEGSVLIAERIIAAQIAIVASCLCALTLAAMFARLRNDAARLRTSEEGLRNALVAGHVFAFNQDVTTGLVERSENAAEILGTPASNVRMGQEAFLQLVHPEDRDRARSVARQLRPEAPFAVATMRVLRSDGRIVWLGIKVTGAFDTSGKLIRIDGLARDVTQNVEDRGHQRMLVEELNHRVNNTLAQVKTLIRRTREAHQTLDDYVPALDGRIDALKLAHQRLSESNWSGVGIGTLLEGELAPYRTAENITLSGPDIVIPSPATVEALASTLYELATNAAKHGSLSTADGRLDVSWVVAVTPEGRQVLRLRWEERASSQLQPPTRQGYGMNLIRNRLTHEADARVDLQFTSNGVLCDIELPIVKPATG